jgi:hypothetical protein
LTIERGRRKNGQRSTKACTSRGEKEEVWIETIG